jgi:ubiquinone/menaquinone biosynthesis C-methylase UbiE
MVDPDAVRRGYDALGSAYADEQPTSGPTVDALREFFEDFPAPSRVLDAGCGPGRPALPLAADVATPVGLDVSRAQLDVAATAAPAARLVQGDMRYLPFSDSAFDGAIALWSLIHVPMADHERALAELARVLRPGGRALVVEGREAWRGENPDWLDRDVTMQWQIAGADATRRQLRSVGFAIHDHRGLPETLADEDTANQEEPLPWRCFTCELDG